MSNYSLLTVVVQGSTTVCL